MCGSLTVDYMNSTPPPKLVYRIACIQDLVYVFRLGVKLWYMYVLTYPNNRCHNKKFTLPFPSIWLMHSVLSFGVLLFLLFQQELANYTYK